MITPLPDTASKARQLCCVLLEGGGGGGEMGELYYEKSLQGQEIVDLCKICTRYIPAKREIRPGKTWQGRPVLVGSQGSAEGALPRLLESTGPFQGINNGVTYLLAGMY